MPKRSDIQRIVDPKNAEDLKFSAHFSGSLVNEIINAMREEDFVEYMLLERVLERYENMKKKEAIKFQEYIESRIAASKLIQQRINQDSLQASKYQIPKGDRVKMEAALAVLTMDIVALEKEHAETKTEVKRLDDELKHLDSKWKEAQVQYAKEYVNEVVADLAERVPDLVLTQEQRDQMELGHRVASPVRVMNEVPDLIPVLSHDMDEQKFKAEKKAAKKIVVGHTEWRRELGTMGGLCADVKDEDLVKTMFAILKGESKIPRPKPPVVKKDEKKEISKAVADQLLKKANEAKQKVLERQLNEMNQVKETLIDELKADEKRPRLEAIKDPKDTSK